MSEEMKAKAAANNSDGSSAYRWRVVVEDRSIAYTMSRKRADELAKEYNEHGYISDWS